MGIGVINFFKNIKILIKHSWILKITADIFKFVETTHESQKPMVCNIAIVNMKDGTKYSDFVSLWAGIGEANPIDRAKQLKNQTTELKRLLKIALQKGENMSDDEKKEINYVLNVFE